MFSRFLLIFLFLIPSLSFSNDYADPIEENRTPQVFRYTPVYDANHTRIRLVKAGTGSHINLVMLPGGPGMDSSYFDGLVSTLKSFKGNVWYIDLPGNGSNVVEDVDYSQWSKYLIDALDSLDNVVLIGHSFGGMLTLSDEEVEKHVRALVILNSAPKFSFKDLAEEVKKYNLPDFGKLLELKKEKGQEVFITALAEDYWAYYWAPTHRKEGAIFFKAAIYNDAPSDEYFLKDMDNFYNKYRAYVPSVPTLVIGGEYDHILPWRWWMEETRFKAPNITLKYFKGAGHQPWIEKPKEVDKLISGFINGINARNY